MKEKIYTEMCSFLSDKEQVLREFQSFYETNKDSNTFLELFDDTYGAMYEAFKGSVKYSVPKKPKIEVRSEINIPITTISEQEYRGDVRIIRKWVQFFGVVLIVSVVLSLIGALIVVSR